MNTISNTKMSSIKEKTEKVQELLNELERSLTLQKLVNDSFNIDDITSNWTKPSGVLPSEKEKHVFTIYANKQVVRVMKYKDVPDILKPTTKKGKNYDK